MSTEDKMIASGGWTAPSETIYELFEQGVGPEVPDVLIKQRVPRPPHNCTTPAIPIDGLEVEWCCAVCGQWWDIEADYCAECGRSGPSRWVPTSHPLEGPHMERGRWWAVVPTSEPISLGFPEVTTTRGGLRYGQ